MELSKQVVSLDLAKRLKELGAHQDSYFAYRVSVDLTGEINYRVTISNAAMLVTSKLDMVLPSIPAYTATELGEILPVFICNQKHTVYKNNCCFYLDAGRDLQDISNLWGIAYADGNDVLQYFTHTLEVEARGLMLCWLIENGYINFTNKDTI